MNKCEKCGHEQHGIAPPDNVKQADEETHRRVDEAVRNGRIEDRRAGGEAVSLSREEIIRMANGFGFRASKKDDYPEEIVTDVEVITIRLCNLVNAAYAAGAAAEREQCAKVCDEKAAMQISMIGLPVAPSRVIQKDRAEQFNKAASAIRARGNGGEK